MEQSINRVLEDIIVMPETIGCVLANKQGLCIAAKGKINPNISGIGVAISEQACKLEPNSDAPTIVLTSGKKRCLIKKGGNGQLTGIVFKQSA